MSDTASSYMWICAGLCVVCFCVGAISGAFFFVAALLVRIPVIEVAISRIARYRQEAARQATEAARDETDGIELEDLAEGGSFDSDGNWVTRSSSREP